jgi:bla regulator protein blaR1
MIAKWFVVMWEGISQIPSIRLRQLALTAGVAAFGLMNISPIIAQSSPKEATPLPSFEVASIRRSRSGENTSFHILQNRLITRNYSLQMLVAFAYGHDLDKFGFSSLRVNQIVGGPGWIYPGEFDYDGYDIDAKVDDSIAGKFGMDCGDAFFDGPCGYREQLILMLQSLFAERFKLKVRHETKKLSVYDLVIARGGPKLPVSAVPDSASTAQNSTSRPPKRPPCPAGMICSQYSTTMWRLANWLSQSPEIGRPVIDQTGISGYYDIKLQFAREQAQDSNAAMGIAPPLGPSGPSIFTALNEQLGLKLEPAKGPVEILVIEHIEKPSEN